MGEYITKRIYDAVSADDGYRVLVDRLWPRGISKAKAMLDSWDKEIAPSSELRKEFHHSEESFDEFASLYKKELDSNPVAVELAQGYIDKLEKENVTLLYGSVDRKFNNAAVLKEWLLELKGEGRDGK